MNTLAFLSSVIVGALGLVGIWLTKRDVKTVRVENTDQHRVAQQGREDEQGELLGHLQAVHSDVRETAHKVGRLDAKLDLHIADHTHA